MAIGLREYGMFSSPFIGYIFGGYAMRRSNVQRIDYSNDTATVIEKTPLNVERRHVRGTGNKNFGYVIGGNTPSPYTDVERIDYSNDDATPLMRGNLTSQTAVHAAMGNQNFGYSAGGYPFRSNINRIDYSNDTATALAKGPLSAGKNGCAGVGNADFGYVGGGNTPGTGLISTVERVDYSNDTATAVAKGPLTRSTNTLAKASNLSFGYFCGGSHPGKIPSNSLAYSAVDRIDYSNDTATASPKGPLSNQGVNMDGTSAAESNNPQ